MSPPAPPRSWVALVGRSLAWAAGVSFCLAAAAQEVHPGAASPAWASLTPAQQSALAPLKKDWESIDAQRKQKWLDVSARLPSMVPQERERIQQRMTEWARMTPAERGQARLLFQEARQLSPGDRQARWEAYQALSPEQRAALAERSRPPSVVPAKSGAREREAQAGADDKQRMAATRAPTQLKPVSPAVVQAKPGASTTLISKTPEPAGPDHAAMHKVAKSPLVVDRNTLLPKRGPQGEGTRAAAATSASQPRQ